MTQTTTKERSDSWKVYRGIGDYEARIVIVENPDTEDQQTENVADVFYNDRADTIVRAVNEYDTLLERIQRLEIENLALSQTKVQRIATLEAQNKVMREALQVAHDALLMCKGGSHARSLKIVDAALAKGGIT